LRTVGILGGTFDPIHNGHLITAQSVLEKRNLEKIIFIPNYISPLKQDVKSSSPEHRLNMLRLALKNNPHFDISDYELNRKRVSYTIDTLTEMKKIYSNIELIIGYDNIVVFDKWYKPEEILKLCKIIVMRRSTDQPIDIKHKYYSSANYVDTPTIEISASNIRARLKQNLTIDNLVPEKVKEYIYGNSLYK